MDEVSDAVPIEDQVPHRMPAKNRKYLLAIAVLVVAVAGYFCIHNGVFAPSIGTQLDDALTQQYIPLAGENSSVTCPPDAHFYAGATIICDITTVAWNSLMPNLKYVDVVVGTHDLYHALPVNG